MPPAHIERRQEGCINPSGTGDHRLPSGMAPPFRAVAAALVAAMAGIPKAQDIQREDILQNCAGGTQVSACSSVTTDSTLCNTSYVADAVNDAYASCAHFPNGSCLQAGYSYGFYSSSQCCNSVIIPVCADSIIISCALSSSSENNGCSIGVNSEGKTCAATVLGTCEFQECRPTPVTTCNYTVPTSDYGPEYVRILTKASEIIGVNGITEGGVEITLADLADLSITAFSQTNDDIDIVLGFGPIQTECVKEALVSVLFKAAQATQTDNVVVTVENCNNVDCPSIDVCPKAEQEYEDTGLRRRRSTAPSAKITVRRPKSGLSGGAIAGIVIGSVAGAALIGTAVWHKWFRNEGGKMGSGGRMYTFL